MTPYSRAKSKDLTGRGTTPVDGVQQRRNASGVCLRPGVQRSGCRERALRLGAIGDGYRTGGDAAVVVAGVGVIDATVVEDAGHRLSNELHAADRRTRRAFIEDHADPGAGNGAVLNEVIGACRPRAPTRIGPFADDPGRHRGADVHTLERRSSREVL